MADKKKDLIEPIDTTFDSVVDAVIGKSPKNSTDPKQVIAGTPDNPLLVGDVAIDCYVLDGEQRVISQRGMVRGLGFSRGSSSRAGAGAELPRFATQKWIEPFISNDLVLALSSPILFSNPSGGGVAYGYPATILADICDAILEADKQGATTERQAPIVQQATVLVRAFARVGIDALVDEVTGFQKDRRHDALRLLLERYIADGLQKWIHTFPDSFFAELDRLYNNAPTTPRSRPQYYGRFINKYVYEPIEHGYVKAELDKLNITDDGKRRARFHQWLNEDGRTILTRQIGKVEGIMEMCGDIEQFKDVAKRRKAVTVAPYLFDEMNRIIE